MKKLFKLFGLIASLAIATISTNASAVAINFSTGLLGTGGTVTDIGSAGTSIIGSGINIGALEAIDTSADGTYTVDAVMNFNTDANTIEIVGTIAALGINSSTTLVSGSFSSWDYGIGSFSGSGIDTKHDDLLNALGVSLGTQFDFFAFTIGFDSSTNIDGDTVYTAVSSSLQNTSVVPVPASIWLLGSGLIGLVGVARRKQ